MGSKILTIYFCLLENVYPYSDAKISALTHLAMFNFAVRLASIHISSLNL